jgi:hypothetical protein
MKFSELNLKEKKAFRTSWNSDEVFIYEKEEQLIMNAGPLGEGKYKPDEEDLKAEDWQEK